MGFCDDGSDDARSDTAATSVQNKPHGVRPGVLDLALVACQSDAAEIVLGPFEVWPEGFEVKLSASLRDGVRPPSDPRQLRSLLDRVKTGGRIGQMVPLFGVRYADGLRADNKYEMRSRPGGGGLLLVRGAASGHSSGSFFGSGEVSRSLE